jgi:hypothetical protein
MNDTLIICGHRYTYWISPRKVTLDRREQNPDGTWSDAKTVAIFRHADAKSVHEMTRQFDTAFALDLLGDRILAHSHKE